MAIAGFLHIRTRSRSEAVAEAWVVQAERCRTAVERVLPDCSVEICFNLGPAGRRVFDDAVRGPLPRRSGWIVGPHASSLLVEKEIVDCDVVCVRLRPGVVERVLGVRPSELAGSLTDVGDVLGSEVNLLRERLDGESPATRIRMIEQYAGQRFARGEQRAENALARHLADSIDAHASVSALARAYGLSHRRVIEMFDRHFGVKPKAFQKIARLRRVLRLIHAVPRPSWAGIAVDCGYFDQAHLVNDFREQTGMTPSEYEASRSSVGHGFAPFRLAQGFPIHA